MANALEGWALFMGRGDKDGIPAIEAGLARMRAAGTELASSLYLAFLADALARSGASQRAIDLAREAVGRAEAGDRLGEAAGHRALALALAHTGDAQSSVALDSAFQLAQRKASPREAALTDLTRAEILRAFGDVCGATEAAESARRAFAALGMRSYEIRAAGLTEQQRG
jgi:predicted ATPase